MPSPENEGMTAEAVARRRAKREAAWAREARDPAAMARRLDAAERTDESDYQRQKERLGVPAVRDPKSVYWGPRLLLQALEAQAATLDAAARQAAACGSIDPAFGSDGTLNVRYVALAGAGPGCVPMVQQRTDLVDPRRPHTEVQLLWVNFIDRGCGEHSSRPDAAVAENTCSRFNATLARLDWPALLKALGW